MKRTWPGALVVVLVAIWASIAADGDRHEQCCGPCYCLICAVPKGTGPMTMSRWAERADMLFIGKVVKAEVVPCCDLYADITFRVTKTWKGHADTSVAVRVGWGCAELFPF